MDTLFTFYVPLFVVGFFFMLGTLGTFLPILPAAFLVWVGILIHKMWVPEGSISWEFFWVLTGVAVMTQIVDWVCTYWGARKFGASWRGGVGAILGILIFPFILGPFLGIIVGPVIGAMGFELLGGRRFREAGKAGMGTVVGGLVALFIKFGCVCYMMGSFLYMITHGGPQ